jgi:3'(2'),5'-bisphosphate nucleotidase
VADVSTEPNAVLTIAASDSDAVAEIFARIAIEAAVPVMGVYAAAEIHAYEKPDQSPVSEADDLAEAVILQYLGGLLPGVPVLSEEAASRSLRKVFDRTFILVDPIDGTREFLSRSSDFTINIGLVVDGEPRAGVVYAPALAKLWAGGASAWSCCVAPGAVLPAPSERRAIHVRRAAVDGLTALASRSHADSATEAFLATLVIAERRAVGSSLKFCAIAEGCADVYPRFGPTMEWDTAAGDAVLRAAGGIVLGEDGARLRYGKAETNFRNGPFVAWGDPAAIRDTPSILR